MNNLCEYCEEPIYEPKATVARDYCSVKCKRAHIKAKARLESDKELLETLHDISMKLSALNANICIMDDKK